MGPSEQRPEFHPRQRIVTEKSRRGISNLPGVQIQAISSRLAPD